MLNSQAICSSVTPQGSNTQEVPAHSCQRQRELGCWEHGDPTCGHNTGGQPGPLTDVKRGPVLCSVRLPMQETQVQTLTQEDPLEEGMATCSRVLACRIPRTEEPGGLQPMGSQSWTRLSDGHTQRGTARDHRDPGPLTTASQPPGVAKDTVLHSRE